MIYFEHMAKFLARPLILVLIMSSFPITSFSAANVSTDSLIEESSLVAERALVHEFMSREDVRVEMTAQGVDPDEALSRINSLSDSEIQKIAGQIETMPAGEGVVGPIVGAIVTVFIILLITDLLCLTSFFNFTRCAR
ncbi:MAG: PA2779 family protein [Gammaproteobacteria bacterium]